MSGNYEFIRLEGSEKIKGSKLCDVFKDWKQDEECFLFVSPHDDDVILGSGVAMQLALKEQVPVYILVVTDGRMGYCTLEEKDTISEVRKKETFDCYEALGIPEENIIWMGMPDCMLSLYQGRRKAKEGDFAVVEGFTGMQNAFTHQLRKIRPTRVFLPTNTDLHPDHKIVHEELLISLFHASGTIWPELGEIIPEVPQIYEMGVYCDFPAAPDIMLRVDDELLEGKIKAIEKFKSQDQIAALIDIVRKSGPNELLRTLNFKFYSPLNYIDMFK